MKTRQKNWAGAALLLLGTVFLLYGLFRGEAGVVLTKAVNLCLECIGIG